MVETLIDFGNGITCHTRLTSGAAHLEPGHRGFHAPELDVTVTENAIADGAIVGGTRALARHLRATISHNRKWTRREILQAFTPGIERVITTALGSMPYVVEAPVEFPDSLHESQYRFTVTLVSPYAFPVGAPRSATTTSDAASTLVYPYTYPYQYENASPAEAIGVDSACEVATPARVTLIPTINVSDVTITISGRETRIVGAMTAGQVLIIDPRPASPVVTVNGVNRLAWFDATTDWPELDPGYCEIAASMPAHIVVEWEPRVMGLI